MPVPNLNSPRIKDTNLEKTADKYTFLLHPFLADGWIFRIMERNFTNKIVKCHCHQWAQYSSRVNKNNFVGGERGQNCQKVSGHGRVGWWSTGNNFDLKSGEVFSLPMLANTAGSYHCGLLALQGTSYIYLTLPNSKQKVC